MLTEKRLNKGVTALGTIGTIVPIHVNRYHKIIFPEELLSDLLIIILL